MPRHEADRAGPFKTPASEFFQHQALEILTLRKMHRSRMISRGTESRDNLRINFCIDRRTRDDLLKQVGIDAARARERNQQTFSSQVISARAN